jgi:hypothetical protein
MTGSSHCRTYPGSGLVLRIFAAEFFLVPSQLRALPDCQSISALTDTETYFSDKRLLPIACMIRLPTAIENIRLSPGAAEDTVANFLLQTASLRF